jgi:regulator of replication initiation timing
VEDDGDRRIKKLEQKKTKLEKAIKAQQLQKEIGLLEARLSELMIENSKSDKFDESLKSTLSKDTLQEEEKQNVHQAPGASPQSNFVEEETEDDNEEGKPDEL